MKGTFSLWSTNGSLVRDKERTKDTHMHAHARPLGEKKKPLFQQVQIVYFNGKERGKEILIRALSRLLIKKATHQIVLTSDLLV